MNRLTREIAFETLYEYLAPIRPYLDDPTVQEVMVNRHDWIIIERAGQMEHLEGVVVSEASLNRALIILRDLNGKGDARYFDARLPGLRLAGAFAPLAVHGDLIAIRKHSRRILTLDDFQGQGAFDVVHDTIRAGVPRNDALLARLSGGGAAVNEFLTWLIVNRVNAACSGGTSSGKTTLLNALYLNVPPEERIVTIEDTAELQLNHPNHVALEARDGVSVRDLVKFSLRLRPDRIVVGEVRGAESIDMMDAMNTGHRGSVFSFHANSSETALVRLESLLRLSEEGRLMSLAELRNRIASTFPFFIHAERYDGSRGPIEIRQVLGVDGDQYRTKLLFKRFVNLEGNQDA
ncbi:CpaF family protein [Burkholderia cenocepacia]|uniref:CpaF family protein n=1 Tax=Burkholderia cenocepacia TaxID=95486 RepID=UPI002230B52B|nr:ATPase, T2SS/T4P/T4SS family [Burkholderia cenocepacia]MCW3677847.1 Flp pilus assembly complex ATPase component TadA [Burkholderia cenocepacia]